MGRQQCPEQPPSIPDHPVAPLVSATPAHRPSQDPLAFRASQRKAAFYCQHSMGLAGLLCSPKTPPLPQPGCGRAAPPHLQRKKIKHLSDTILTQFLSNSFFSTPPPPGWGGITPQPLSPVPRQVMQQQRLKCILIACLGPQSALPLPLWCRSVPILCHQTATGQLAK